MENNKEFFKFHGIKVDKKLQNLLSKKEKKEHLYHHVEDAVYSLEKLYKRDERYFPLFFLLDNCKKEITEKNCSMLLKEKGIYFFQVIQETDPQFKKEAKKFKYQIVTAFSDSNWFMPFVGVVNFFNIKQQKETT